MEEEDLDENLSVEPLESVSIDQIQPFDQTGYKQIFIYNTLKQICLLFETPYSYVVQNSILTLLLKSKKKKKNNLFSFLFL